MIWAKRIGVLLAGLAALSMVFAAWVYLKTSSILDKTWDIERTRIEHPWPFNDQDLAMIRAELLAQLPKPAPIAEGEEAPEPVNPLIGADLNAMRTSRAIGRGERLGTRLGCMECHGADLGGTTVMDVPAVQGIIAPNLTLGEGGLPGEYTLDDFDRIVRHGVRRDGRTALMPAIDFEGLSNKEVSDLYAWVLSKPHVDRTLPPSYWGPVMRVLVATGQVPPPAAFRIDHDRRNPQEPPTKQIDATYGAHLAKTCRGCHREDFVGGPIRDGDPSWPPAGNLTPHEEGLKSWSKTDFFQLLRTGKRPDGSEVDPQGMPWRTVGQLDDIQTEAIWVYLQSLPAKTTGR